MSKKEQHGQVATVEIGKPVEIGQAVEIRNDVPMPTTRSRWPWASMQVGESVGSDKKSVQSSAWAYAKKHGGAFRSGKDPEGKYAVRVWRTE